LRSTSLASQLRQWREEQLADIEGIARVCHRIGGHQPRARFGEQPDGDDVDDILCTLGQRYASSAVLGPAHDGVYGRELEQRAVPGIRAPHLWLDRDGVRISVHDLFHDAFVLLTGEAGAAGWVDAAARAAGGTRVPLRAYRVGPAGSGAELVDVEGAWASRYGDGAVLVRPDGYVAWRSAGPDDDLADALRTLLSVS